MLLELLTGTNLHIARFPYKKQSPQSTLSILIAFKLSEVNYAYKIGQSVPLDLLQSSTRQL
jgi:hypothetical protein